MDFTPENLDRLASLVRQLQGLVPAGMGTVTLTWPGGVEETAVTVSHGLGRVPARVLVATQATAGTKAYAWVESRDAVHITIGVTSPGFTPAASSLTDVAWWAW